MALSKRQQELCERDGFDFSDLSALFLNCTLKPTGVESNTEELIGISKAIMEANGV